MPEAISSDDLYRIDRQSLLAAVNELRSGRAEHSFSESAFFDLLIAEEQRYSPKPVVGLAARRALGRALGPKEFNGGETSTAFRLLWERGFEIATKPRRIRDLDAMFSIGRDKARYFVILESRGPKRNTEYARGFEAILYSLGDLDARIHDVRVTSRETRAFSIDERRVKLGDRRYPFRLRDVDDLRLLRREIARGAQRVGRAGGTGGNNTRRLRIEFDLPKPLSLRALSTLISEDSAASAGPVRTVEFTAKPPTATTSGGSRRAVGSTHIERAHAALQHRLYEHLVAEVGAQNVSCELQVACGRPADVVVRQGDSYVVYEIKSSISPRECVRQAFGQLLEYSYWPGSENCVALRIVGPTAIDPRTAEYLEIVRATFGIPVEYVHLPVAFMSSERAAEASPAYGKETLSG